MLLQMCRASATSACLAVHATHARAVVAAEAAAATATTTTKTARWAHVLTPEKAAWAWLAPAKTAQWESSEDWQYGESGASFPDGLDLDLSGRNACGDGSDGDGGKDGRIGQEADSGAVPEVEGDAGYVGTTETALKKPKPSRLRRAAGRQG